MTGAVRGSIKQRSVAVREEGSMWSQRGTGRVRLKSCARVSVVWCAAAALCVAMGPRASADSSTTLPACSVYAGAFGLSSKGIAGPTFDDFSTPNSSFWCNADEGAAQLTFGHGLTLAIRPNLPLVHHNAEVIQIPRIVPGTTFAVRVDGAQLADAFGSRGWGMWNRDLDSPPTSEIAWFMYQRSDVPGLTAAGPTGFFVLAQGAGNPIPAIKYLPTSLLNGTHTYSVTLGTDAVTFGVDGNTVAKFTGRAYVPAGTAGPVVSQIWIDSNFYTYTFLPIGQVTDVPATAHIEWFKEGLPAS